MALAANRAVSQVRRSTRRGTDPTHREGWYFRSDHLPYARAGVPALFFTTLLHADYHTPLDKPDRIDIAEADADDASGCTRPAGWSQMRTRDRASSRTSSSSADGEVSTSEPVSRGLSGQRTFRLLTVPVFLFALVFPLLAINVAARLLAHADIQDTGNLALLLTYELTRALIGLLAMGFALLLVLRKSDQPAARQLVWLLLFGSIAYAIAFGGGGYVGPFQEWLTRTLMERDRQAHSDTPLASRFAASCCPAPGRGRFQVLLSPVRRH